MPPHLFIQSATSVTCENGEEGLGTCQYKQQCVCMATEHFLLSTNICLGNEYYMNNVLKS